MAGRNINRNSIGRRSENTLRPTNPTPRRKRTFYSEDNKVIKAVQARIIHTLIISTHVGWAGAALATAAVFLGAGLAAVDFLAATMAII